MSPGGFPRPDGLRTGARTMAGKFLTLEETARRLGISVDEVNRLVDRKALFPMRAGTSIKFKVEDVERAAADLGTSAAPSGGDGDLDLGLELELSAPMLDAGGGSGGDDLLLGSIATDEESIFADGDEGAGGSASHTVVRGGGQPAASVAGAFDDDLVMESVIGVSSPSLGGSLATPEPAGGASGTLEIDLSDVAGSLAGGSLAGISGISAPGVAAADTIDSGLSLEGPDAGLSGIDLDTSLVAEGSLAVGGSLAGSLPGEAFELGADTDDEESASVVIATEETGDSSFFETAADDSASVSFDGSSASADLIGGSVIAGDDLSLPASVAPLSVWQVVGLVCCTLLLSLVVLVVFDVLQTVRAPQGSPVSGPLLNALAKTFGW